MKNFSVAGVTYENRQSVIKGIINTYKAKGELVSWEGLNDKEILAEGAGGSEFEHQELKGIATLKKEPNNPHDPNAIAVYVRDAKHKKFHVGYIPKEHIAEVSMLMKRTTRIDVEFLGGRKKYIDIDDDDNEYITDETLTNGILLLFIDVVETTKNNPFLKEGDGSTKTKITNRIGCGLMIFIVLMIIIVIFT